MKVLLIEPVTELRVMLRGVLKMLDITDLYEPRTSLEGMKYLLDTEIDLLIFSKDIQPFNGFLSMKMIRNSKEENIRSLRTIMTSGHVDEETEQQALEFGVDIFLRKPFSADDVRATIMRIINDRNAFLETPVYTGPCRRTYDTLKAGEYDRRDPTYNPGKGKYDKSLRTIVQRILNAREKKAKNALSAREAELKSRGGIIVDREFEEENKSLIDLKVGMVTSKPIKTSSGMMIMPTATVICTKAIARLKDLIQTSKLNDGFWVQKGVLKGEEADASEAENAYKTEDGSK